MGMRNIADYFDAPFTVLRPGIPLTCNIHIYFQINNHIILWHRAGDIPQEGVLQTYLTRGLERIWVHKNDEEAFNRYKDGGLTSIRPPSPIGIDIGSLLKAPPSCASKRDEDLESHAQSLLQNLAQANTPDALSNALDDAKNAIDDALQSSLGQIDETMADLWKIASIDPCTQHGSTVATFAVLFSFAIRMTEPEHIATTALSGLLHDIGLSQLPFDVACLKWKAHSPDELNLYITHHDRSMDLLEDPGNKIPKSVLQTLNEIRLLRTKGTATTKIAAQLA
jgi:hypothetical protein